MAMKAWASGSDESIDMIRLIAKQNGFTVDGRVLGYVTEPEQPPGEMLHGYDITFTPYEKA